MLKSSVPDDVEANITIDDISLKSSLTTNKTRNFTIKKIFYTILGFTQSHSGPLGDIKGYIQLIPGTYKSEKPIKVNGIDEVHFKCDCINGSILNGVRQDILYSFASDRPPGQKI